MSRIFIHCGAPKTGTSYLQVLFARYSDALAKSGIVYPEDASVARAREGTITSGNGVGMANYLRPNLPHDLPNKDGWINQFRKTLAKAKGKDLLFSSEFIVFPSGSRSDAVRAAIEEAGYTPQLIYFVRDLARAARSVYSQQIKRAGETRDFVTFLRDWDPHYFHHVRLMINTFGAENLLLYNYEEQSDKLADLVFRDILGTDFSIETNFSINRSLNDKEIELLRVMNGYFPQGQSHLSTFVSDALMRIPAKQDVFGLTKPEFERVRRRFSAGMKTVNDHIRGEKIRITPRVLLDREQIELGDFEMAMIAIIARIVAQRS